MRLRILESEWNPFVAALCDRSDVETAGVILAERLRDDVLLARELLLVPEDGYQVRRADHIRIDPVTINRLVRPAREQGLSVITVHTHPHSDLPWFSAADDDGDARLIPSLLTQMSGPHGSLVVAGATGIPTARVWSDAGAKNLVDVHVVGKGLRISAAPAAVQDVAGWFDRQRLALGEDGQRILRNLHVGVVGLGGTGSVVFVQLVHLGVGEITVVDGDRVERSNVSRILGSTSADAGVTWKVDVAARYAEMAGLGTKVNIHRGNLGVDVAAGELANADVIMSCVDRHLPRALLNRLAYEKAIPMIDMGSALRVDGDGALLAGAGRVVIVGPGRPCLACWGHIDSNRIRIESLSSEDRAREAADGYVSGADIAQPSVVAFNTTIAGAAVVELLRISTAFAGVDDPPMRLAFDFESGAVRRNRLNGAAECKICGRVRAGDAAALREG